MSENKIKFGLKNTHYAVITEVGTTVSYGTSKPIPGAVNLNLSPVGDKFTFYADDRAYFEENVNDGYDGSLEMAVIPDDFRVEVLGEERDINGVLIENANAVIKKIALMFEFDGDAKKTRHVLYNVLPSRPNMDSSTKSGPTKEPKTESMNISARPAIDTGDVKAKCNQGDTGYDTFFASVYRKDAPINTPDVESFNFSKAVQDDIDITTTSTATSGVTVKNVLIDGVPVAGIYLTVSGTDVSIAAAAISGLDNGIYTVLVEFTKGNAVTVLLEVGA